MSNEVMVGNNNIKKKSQTCIEIMLFRPDILFRIENVEFSVTVF